MYKILSPLRAMSIYWTSSEIYISRLEHIMDSWCQDGLSFLILRRHWMLFYVKILPRWVLQSFKRLRRAWLLLILLLLWLMFFWNLFILLCFDIRINFLLEITLHEVVSWKDWIFLRLKTVIHIIQFNRSLLILRRSVAYRSFQWLVNFWNNAFRASFSIRSMIRSRIFALY